MFNKQESGNSGSQDLIWTLNPGARQPLDSADEKDHEKDNYYNNNVSHLKDNWIQLRDTRNGVTRMRIKWVSNVICYIHACLALACYLIYSLFYSERRQIHNVFIVMVKLLLA